MQFFNGFLSIAAALVAPVAAAAQTLTISALSLTAHHELLGDALLGGGVQLILPRTYERLAFHLGAERLSGSAGRIGSTCTGLVQPGACPPEPLRDRAQLTGASGEVVIRALGDDPVSVDGRST